MRHPKTIQTLHRLTKAPPFQKQRVFSNIDFIYYFRAVRFFATFLTVFFATVLRLAEAFFTGIS
jgi:hypothetical protein